MTHFLAPDAGAEELRWGNKPLTATDRKLSLLGAHEAAGAAAMAHQQTQRPEAHQRELSQSDSAVERWALICAPREVYVVPIRRSPPVSVERCSKHKHLLQEETGDDLRWAGCPQELFQDRSV